MLLAVPATDYLSTSRYRRNKKAEYENYVLGRTAGVFRARQLLTEARELTEHRDLAKALVAVREALDIAPDYSDAIELQRLIKTLAADQPALAATDVAPAVPDVDDVLFLRVVGTPYAYRAATGATTVRVGRQRARLANGADPQNDLVIRIPASDDRTVRISRHHFEIDRIGHEYFVVDHSGGNTKLNGSKLAPGRPEIVTSGDRLVIADVLTLEVSVRSGGPLSGARVVQLGNQVRYEMEATLGDMLTEI
jgi:pSer/pThr/pTyr-binding forkhead associated (FHA) protein